MHLLVILYNFFKKRSFLCFINKTNIHKKSKVYRFSRITSSFIGKYTYIGPNTVIKNCEIGNYCSIAQNVKIGLGIHPINFISTSPLFYSPKNPLNINFSKKTYFNSSKRTIIGNDVWIGTNVVIFDGVKIGNGSIIAAGAIVNKDVPEYNIYGGVPARKISERFDDSIKKIVINSEWWNEDYQFLNKSVFTKEVASNLMITDLKIHGK